MSTVEFDYTDDQALFDLIGTARKLDPFKRYWIFHLLIGLIGMDARGFRDRVERFGARDPAGCDLMKGRKGSLFPDLELALDFIEGRDDRVEEKVARIPLGNTKPETLDVLARHLIATDRNDLAFSCLDAIEARLGEDAHMAPRRASLYFSMGQIDKANGAYAGFIESLNNNPGAGEFWRPFEKAAADLKGAIETGRTEMNFNEAYWGDKDKVRSNWQLYLAEFQDSHRYSGTGSQINAALTDAIARCFAEDGEIALALNVGSFCGYHDLQRAQAFPACRWIGYDRESIAIALNRERFQAPNLAFADGELEQAMAGEAAKSGIGRSLICHTRAATEMPPAVVENIYKAAGRAGIEWIVGAEWFGPNPLTKEYFDDKKAGITSQIISLQTVSHPYQRMLDDAGYEVIEILDEPMVAYEQLANVFPSSGFFSSNVIRTFRARLA